VLSTGPLVLFPPGIEHTLTSWRVDISQKDYMYTVNVPHEDVLLTDDHTRDSGPKGYFLVTPSCLGLCKYSTSFTQRQDGLMTHSQKNIPIIRQCMTVGLYVCCRVGAHRDVIYAR
jgi:hypothetical protein